MRRYRIFSFDFDYRINLIDVFEKSNKEEREVLMNGFKSQFGTNTFGNKLQNLKDIGPKSASIIAYHNIFMEQIRNSFIMEHYFPALTGSCVLGERILNYLILNLREHYKATDEYKSIRDNESFDNWDKVIKILSNWNVLMQDTTTKFTKLKKLRNKSIHFNAEIEKDIRSYALESINLIQEIINEQFTAFGNRPWLIANIPGEIYIKKDWESEPFIKVVYLPNCIYVSPYHKIISLVPLSVEDHVDGDEIDDKTFSELRLQFNK